MTRAHSVADGTPGGSRQVQSISSLAAELACRLEGGVLVPPLLEALLASSRVGAELRLFDAIEVLAAKGALSLPTLEARLPEGRRWVAWAAVSQAGAPALAELRARFGEPPKERLYAVARVLAKAGRVDDAVAISAHPSAYWTSRAADTPRPPPTQDALREIVRTNVPLTPKQRKQIAAALKSAPRLRDAHSQETYKALCAEVEQRLGARSK